VSLPASARVSPAYTGPPYTQSEEPQENYNRSLLRFTFLRLSDQQY